MTLEEDHQREEPAKLSNSTPNPSERVEEGCTACMEPLPQLNSQITQEIHCCCILWGTLELQGWFQSEYGECVRMETLARRFIKMDAQWKGLSLSSKEYQNVPEKVSQEFRKIRQSQLPWRITQIWVSSWQAGSHEKTTQGIQLTASTVLALELCLDQNMWSN